MVWFKLLFALGILGLVSCRGTHPEQDFLILISQEGTHVLLKYIHIQDGSGFPVLELSVFDLVREQWAERLSLIHAVEDDLLQQTYLQNPQVLPDLLLNVFSQDLSVLESRYGFKITGPGQDFRILKEDQGVYSYKGNEFKIGWLERPAETKIFDIFRPSSLEILIEFPEFSRRIILPAAGESNSLEAGKEYSLHSVKAKGNTVLAVFSYTAPAFEGGRQAYLAMGFKF